MVDRPLIDLSSWLLVGVLACLVSILYALVVWLRSWGAFVREYRDGQEAMKRLLLGNFSDLIETLRRVPFDEEEDAPRRQRSRT
jgi:hypothetical protein